MSKLNNNWTILGLSILIGPILVFYWIYFFLKGLFFESSIQKGIRQMGIADIGFGLSIASILAWFIVISSLL